MLELKDVSPSDNQQVFNYVLRTILEQGERSVDGNGNCKYRSQNEDGKILKCAAGQLIPDEDYKKDFEGLSVTPDYTPCNDTSQYFLCKGYNLDFVNKLQNTHDFTYSNTSEEFVSKYKKRMREVAAIYSLDFPEETRV